MAKHHKSGADSAAAEDGSTPSAPAPQRFAVFTLSKKYNGHHPWGLRFSDGRGVTEDAALADRFRADGYVVKSDKPADVLTAAEKAEEQAAAIENQRKQAIEQGENN